MKKLLLIAITGIIFIGCAKDVKSPANETTPNAIGISRNTDGTGGYKPVRGIATVIDSKEAGFGYYLKFNEFEWEIPYNLPAEYKVQGVKVDVAYRFTDKQVEGEFKEPKYYIEIIDINPATKQPQ